MNRSPITTRIFLSLLAPTILMNLTTALASFADTMIVGYYLDDATLSVITYATPIYMILNTFAALFAVGGSISMSVDAGKGDKAGSNRVFSTTVILLTLFGGLLTLGGILLYDVIPLWLGANPLVIGRELYDLVGIYVGIIMWCAPLFMLNIGLAFFVRNDGRPTLSMVGMFLSVAVNIVLDILLIGPCGLGVAGAALATALGQLVSVAVIASHFFSKKNTLRFVCTLGGQIWRIIKNGIGTALHFVYQFASILIINHVITVLGGNDAMVVYTVVFNLYTVSLALFEGISQTVQPMISLYFGEKNIPKIKHTLQLALWAIILLCGTVTVLLELFPQVVPMLFGVNSGVLLQSSCTAVRIFATSMLVMTVNVVLGYYLQSTEHSLFASVLVSLRCFVFFMLGVFVLGALCGLNGVWASYTAAEVLTLLVTVGMLLVTRASMRRRGTDANLLLLDTTVERGTGSRLCRRGQALSEFAKDVRNDLQSDSAFSEAAVEATVAYLNRLASCSETEKAFVEAEWIADEHKIIIKDTLSHETAALAPKDAVPPAQLADYGPTLGVNRVCIQ